jgi:ribose-phosphate pyrophosphokinase
MKLLAGNSNPELAQGISDYLEIPQVKAKVKRFADGEVFVEINENVRGEDVFIVQSTCAPTNDNLMELLVLIDALSRSICGAHYGGGTLLRLRTPGPQARPSHAN